MLGPTSGSDVAHESHESPKRAPSGLKRQQMCACWLYSNVHWYTCRNQCSEASSGCLPTKISPQWKFLCLRYCYISPPGHKGLFVFFNCCYSRYHKLKKLCIPTFYIKEIYIFGIIDLLTSECSFVYSVIKYQCVNSLFMQVGSHSAVPPRLILPGDASSSRPSILKLPMQQMPRMFQQPLPSYVMPSRIIPLTPSYEAKGSTKYNRSIPSLIGPETQGMCLNIP